MLSWLPPRRPAFAGHRVGSLSRHSPAIASAAWAGIRRHSPAFAGTGGLPITPWQIASSVVPVFAVMGLGVLLSRRLDVDNRTLTTLTLYVFTPCLIFDALVRKGDRGSFLAIAALVVVLVAFCLAAAAVAARFARVDRAAAVSLSGSAAFINSGNMGLPIALFAYGPDGLARAASFLVAMSVLINSVGIVLFSRGRDGGDAGRTFRELVRLPLLYAAVLGLVIPAAGVTIPPIVGRPISMLGEAAIPVLLLAFGIQLGRIGFRLPDRATWCAVGIRIVISPLFAYGLARAMLAAGAIDRMDAKVYVVMAGLPPAVYNFLLAERFGGDVRVASEAILWATTLSFFSVSLILGLLG